MKNKIIKRDELLLLVLSFGVSGDSLLPSVLFTKNILTINSLKLIQVIVITLFFILALFKKKKIAIKRKDVRCYSLYFNWLIVSAALSVLQAAIYHNQDVFVGIIATSIYVVFLSYYIFLSFSFSSESIVTIFKILGVANVIAIFLSFLTMPECLFGSYELDSSRGFRIRAGNVIWVYLAMIFWEERFLKSLRVKYLFISAICFFSVSLLLTRQFIIISLIMITLAVWIEGGKKIKFLFLIILIMGIGYVMSLDIIKDVVEMTANQHEDIKSYDDIRSFSARYYLFEGQTDIITCFFGNGVWSVNNSQYGYKMASLGLMPADVGYLGFYYYFGVFGVIPIILIMIKSLKNTANSRNKYVFFFFVGFALSSFVGGSVTYPSHLYIWILMIYYSTIKIKIEQRNINNIVTKRNGC